MNATPTPMTTLVLPHHMPSYAVLINILIMNNFADEYTRDDSDLMDAESTPPIQDVETRTHTLA